MGGNGQGGREFAWTGGISYGVDGYITVVNEPNRTLFCLLSTLDTRFPRLEYPFVKLAISSFSFQC